MINRTRLVMALSLIGLAGCGSIAQTETKIEQVKDSTAALQALVERNATNGSVIRTARPRLAGEEIVIKGSALPSVFGEKMSYVTKGSQSLVQTLEDISAASGIAIRTTEIANLAQRQPSQGSDPLSGVVSLDYSGTARGLLDEIASKADATWRYNVASKAVEFFRFETRTLPVNVPAGSKTVTAGISLAGVSGGGGSGGAGGAGGSNSASAGNVSVSQTLTIDPWSSIMGGVQSILGASGRAPAGGQPGALPAGAQMQGHSGGSGYAGAEGTAIPNPELGLITVTAKPQVMERVVRYVSSINSRFSQNVLIDVKIYSVTMNAQRSYGFNLNLLYNKLNKYGASITGPGALQPGTGTPGILTLSSKDPNNRWNSSTLVAEALEQFGDVALETQRQVLAVNGQPSPVQDANEINYTSGSSIVPQSGNQGSIITKTQSTKVVGFTANFTPLILGDNRILLTYQMNISALAAPLTPDAQGVTNPLISSQSLPGQAFVRDGQAIVLFGSDSQRNGVGSALHPGGYSKSSTKERQMLVIVVQVNTGAKDEQM
jgi:hypothetical protein